MSEYSFESRSTASSSHFSAISSVSIFFNSHHSNIFATLWAFLEPEHRLVLLTAGASTRQDLQFVLLQLVVRFGLPNIPAHARPLENAWGEGSRRQA